MSMFNDTVWNKKSNKGECISNSAEIRDYEKRFSQGHWTFLGPGNEEQWYGHCFYKLEGKWNSVPAKLLQRFEDTGHPILTSGQCSESWNPEETEKKPYISLRKLQT